jgi:uncharacterized protein YkwD
MLSNGYFEHTSPTGITPWYWFRQAGYNYQYAGENLAMDFFETKDVFTAWMNSPGHRANILNPNFKEIGVAVATGQMQNRSTTLAVLSFGTQFSSKTTTKVVVQASPSVSPAPPKASTSPKISQAPTPKTSPPASPLVTKTPSVNTPSTSPIAQNKTLGEAIVLKTTLENQPVQIVTLTASETPLTSQSLSLTSKVLGTFTSRYDEMARSLYLYFTLFLIAALCVNIFVKIKIQYWATIGASTFLIILSALLIFI